jgi:hypothetical protein
MLFVGHLMLYMWCPKALVNWSRSGSLPVDEILATPRFLGLSEQWKDHLDPQLLSEAPWDVQSWADDVVQHLSIPYDSRDDPHEHSLWETEAGAASLISKEHGFYVFASGLFPEPDGQWRIIFQKPSFLRRLYLRYQVEAVCGLIAAREMGLPVKDAVVVGWKNAEHVVTLREPEVAWVAARLEKTRSILRGEDPPPEDVGERLCRFCYQESCPRKRFFSATEPEGVDEVAI